MTQSTATDRHPAGAQWVQRARADSTRKRLPRCECNQAVAGQLEDFRQARERVYRGGADGSRLRLTIIE